MRPDECWLELDEDLERDLRMKDTLLRRQRDQVFVETSSSKDAQREALSRVTTSLQAFHPEIYEIEGPRFHVEPTGDVFDLDASTLPPLEIAARCVQDDLVIMQEGPLGWCLTAGAVCFPTRWDLPSKLGRPMSRIHERVPSYLEELETSANRFFDRMKPGRIVETSGLFRATGKL